MKRDVMVEHWPGGVSAFRFDIGAFEGLQKALDSGPNRVLLRLVTADWRIGDVIETIRFGLIGGGEKPEQARTLAVNALDDWSPYRLALLAARILERYLMQDAQDPTGEETGNDAPSEDPLGRWKFSDYYAAGAVLGFTPQQVEDMTLWQFRAALDGWRAANAGDEAPKSAFSDDELKKLGIVGGN